MEYRKINFIQLIDKLKTNQFKIFRNRCAAQDLYNKYIPL